MCRRCPSLTPSQSWLEEELVEAVEGKLDDDLEEEVEVEV